MRPRPRHGFGLPAALLGAAVLAGGCQLLVGLDPVRLAPDGGAGACDPACPFVCSAGVCTGMCVPGATQCNGDAPQTCDATGTWQSGAACPKVCSAGACAGKCIPGSMQCSDRTPQTCDATGRWVSGTTCAHLCQAGACAGVCDPGDARCQGDVPQMCDATGQWQSGTACPFVCSAGGCAGKCAPGDTRKCGSADTCNAAATQTCDGTGTWGPCQPAPSPCVATPAGWSPVALTGGACPSGFGAPAVRVSGVTASPYTCSCSCSGSQVCSGTVTLEQYPSGTCTGSPLSSAVLDVSPTCAANTGGQSIVLDDGYILSSVAFGPTPACGATPIATMKPGSVETTVTVCQPDLACTAGACLSPAEQGSMCVSQAGSIACPAGFPNQTLVSLGVTDDRACTCACGSTLSCALTSALFDSDSSCTGAYSVTANAASCTSAFRAFSVGSTQANATVTGSGACAQTAPSTPTGGVALDPASTMTVCCP